MTERGEKPPGGHEGEPKQKSLLPKVSPDIGLALQREIEDAGSEHDYIIEIIKRLNKENPAINTFLSKATEQFKSVPEVRTEAMKIGYFVYRLLESQAQADKMNEEFREKK